MGLVSCGFRSRSRLKFSFLFLWIWHISPVFPLSSVQLVSSWGSWEWFISFCQRDVTVCSESSLFCPLFLLSLFSAECSLRHIFDPLFFTILYHDAMLKAKNIFFFCIQANCWPLSGRQLTACTNLRSSLSSHGWSHGATCSSLLYLLHRIFFSLYYYFCLLRDI